MLYSPMLTQNPTDNSDVDLDKNTDFFVFVLFSRLN